MLPALSPSPCQRMAHGSGGPGRGRGGGSPPPRWPLPTCLVPEVPKPTANVSIRPSCVSLGSEGTAHVIISVQSETGPLVLMSMLPRGCVWGVFGGRQGSGLFGGPSGGSSGGTFAHKKRPGPATQCAFVASDRIMGNDVCHLGASQPTVRARVEQAMNMPEMHIVVEAAIKDDDQTRHTFIIEADDPHTHSPAFSNATAIGGVADPDNVVVLTVYTKPSSKWEAVGQRSSQIGSTEWRVGDFARRPVRVFPIFDHSANVVLGKDGKPAFLRIALVDLDTFPRNWPVPRPLPEETFPKHLMIITRGTRGDIQPFAALAKGLAERLNYKITLCTEMRYAASGTGGAGTVWPLCNTPTPSVGQVAGPMFASGFDCFCFVVWCTWQWDDTHGEKVGELLPLKLFNGDICSEIMRVGPSSDVCAQGCHTLKPASSCTCMCSYACTV